MSRSVTPLIAETTTTARSHTTSCSRAISASAAIAVAFPTDVPPNFTPKRDILNPFTGSVIEQWRHHRRDLYESFRTFSKASFSLRQHGTLLLLSLFFRPYGEK